MEKVLLLLIGELTLVLSFFSTTKNGFNVDETTEQYYNQHYSDSDIGQRIRRETIRFENDVVVIPENYSIHEPPPTQDGPTIVDFYILIIDIRDINEVQEEMTLEMNLQIYWKDSRLSHWALPKKQNSKSKFGVLNPSLIEDIWHPDIFIDHVKKIDQPKVISVPSSLRFYFKDSTFRYSGRYTMKIGCQMVFQYYPADTQRCNIEVKSYSYSASTLVLNWRDGKKPAVKQNLTLPNFALALGNPEEFWLNTSSSAYSVIRFAVVLRRHLGFHLIQTYLLSSLFVILSFLTFLVAHESVLECMAQNTPTVSYVKGLDIWMVTCIFSVFFTLVEHTVLLRLRTGNLIGHTNAGPQAKKRRRSIFSISSRKMKKDRQLQSQDPLALYYHKCSSKCKCSSGTSDNSPILEIRRNTADRTSSSTSALWRNDFLSSIPTLSPSITPTLSPVRGSSRATTSMSMLLEDHHHQYHYPHSQTNGRLPARSISGLPTIHSEANNNNNAGGYSNSEAKRKYLNFRRMKKATNLEMFFSKLIPIGFLIFNCIYWPWLLMSADYYNEAEFLDTNRI